MSRGHIIATLAPWAWRFAVVATVAGLTGAWIQPASFVFLAILGGAAGLFYSLAVVAPLAALARRCLPPAAAGARQRRRPWDRHPWTRQPVHDAVMERSSDIRVAHLVPAPFDPEDGIIGGAERYSFELARHMADRVPTELISFGPRERSATVGNLRVRVLRAHYVRGQRTNPDLRCSCWRALGDATVVHCHQQHVLASSVAAVLHAAAAAARVRHRSRRRRTRRLDLRVHRPLVSRSSAHQRVQPQGRGSRAQSAGARHPRRRRHIHVLASAQATARRCSSSAGCCRTRACTI